MVIFYVIPTALAHMGYAQEFNFLSFIFLQSLKSAIYPRMNIGN